MNPFQDPASICPSEQFDRLYREHWGDIKSSPWQRQTDDSIINKFSIRVSGRDLDKCIIDRLLRKFDSNQSVPYKINCCVSLFLRINTSHADTLNVDEERSVRYFYPSSNTAFFKTAKLVNSPSSLNNLIDDIVNFDVEGYSLRANPDSKWITDHIGSIFFIVAYLPNSIYINGIDGKKKHEETPIYF